MEGNMEKEISYFYFNINKMNYFLAKNKDVVSKLLVGRVKSSLRNYKDEEWDELKIYFDGVINYCCYSNEDYCKLLILFVIISSYKSKILNYDIDILNSLIEMFIQNQINPMDYERYVNLCFSKENNAILIELQKDVFYPLTFLLEAITEKYSIDELEQKDGILFKTILQKVANKYEGPIFKNNLSCFNIIITLKKIMDEINRRRKVFSKKDYQSLYNLEKLFLENDIKESLVNQIKDIEEELLSGNIEKIEKILGVIKMANQDMALKKKKKF